MTVLLVTMIGALVLLGGLALVIDQAVRRRRLGPPGPRPDGLGDDLRLGIGINSWP